VAGFKSESVADFPRNPHCGRREAVVAAAWPDPKSPPRFRSISRTGKHWIYDKGRFRSQPSKRAAGANSAEVELSLTTGLPYACEDHTINMFVLDEDVGNATTPTNPFEDATEFLI
jgi:hypothetical protein